MHGTIAMSLNRKGRKRKSGRRTPSGAVARRVPVDYRSMAALQPHRIRLPEALRSDEKAESVLGCLNLIYRISKRTAANRPGITDEQYDAGRRYAVIVGAYLAMASAPRSTAGAGRSQGCAGDLDCPADTCRCRALTKRYTDAYVAVEKAGGHKVHLAVKRVAIHDEACQPDDVEALKLGLSALARHFGLTNHRK